MSTEQDTQGTSTRPYLIRALHDWCTDNGFTPYLAVYVDRSVQVPQEYVKNNEIVLNVSFEATSQLQLGNEFIEFKARFGGMAREISVPIDHVIAIYARENGQGMAFPVPTLGAPSEDREGIVAVGTESSVESLSLADLPNVDERAPTPLRLANKGPKLTSASKERLTAAPKLDGLSQSTQGQDDEPPDSPTPGGAGRPALRRIK